SGRHRPSLLGAESAVHLAERSLCTASAGRKQSSSSATPSLRSPIRTRTSSASTARIVARPRLRVPRRRPCDHRRLAADVQRSPLLGDSVLDAEALDAAPEAGGALSRESAVEALPAKGTRELGAVKGVTDEGFTIRGAPE